MLPWLLAQAGVSNHAAGPSGVAAVPDTVRYAFDLGAGVMLAAILWTVIRTREYPPDTLLSFEDATPALAAMPPTQGWQPFKGVLWGVVGLAGVITTRLAGLDPQLYLVCGGALLWGLAHTLYKHGLRSGPFATIMGDLAVMPLTMRRLAPVQFFSWLALFAMWIYTTAAVAQVHFGASDPHSEIYNRAANWVGVLFAAYNGFAALAAAVIPLIGTPAGSAGEPSRQSVDGWRCAVVISLHSRSALAAAALLGMGFAWGSILSLPYALLSSSVPAKKMGVYMGIFNFFIVIPQLVAASMLGLLLRALFGGAPIYALVLGGVSLVVAGLLVLRVPQAAGERPGESLRSGERELVGANRTGTT